VEETKIHLRNDKPTDIHFDGEKGLPINAVLVLARRSDENGCHILSYGNSDVLGNLVMTFYERCIREHPETAEIMEKLAKDIVDYAACARGEHLGGFLT